MIGFVCIFEFFMIFAFANIYPIFKLHQDHNYYVGFSKHITNTFSHGLDLTKRIVSGIHGHVELRVLRNLIFLIIMQVGVIIKFAMLWLDLFASLSSLHLYFHGDVLPSACVFNPLPNAFCGCDPLPSALVVTIISWCSCVAIPLLIILNGCDLLPWCSCVLRSSS